ncbi:MAG: hypothetical protein M3409_07315, partial [Gemmatimonadota bacterium]|nr:hypothetical protein [Gemmatimonadota bacterium]
MKRTPLVLVTLLAAACAPRIQPLQPTLRNGAVLPATGEGVTERARAAGEIERERLTEERIALQAEALAGCAPAQCDA